MSKSVKKSYATNSSCDLWTPTLYYCNCMCTFFCSGVCAIDRDSVMQETTSSAASALSRQNSIASPISSLRGVSPLSKASNLSLCLRHNKHSQYKHTLQNQTYVGSQTSQAYAHFISKKSTSYNIYFCRRGTHVYSAFRCPFFGSSSWEGKELSSGSSSPWRYGLRRGGFHREPPRNILKGDVLQLFGFSPWKKDINTEKCLTVFIQMWKLHLFSESKTV